MLSARLRGYVLARRRPILGRVLDGLDLDPERGVGVAGLVQAHVPSRRRSACHARWMAKVQAVYYRDRRGAEPVDLFIEKLSPKRAAKVDDYVEEHLNGRSPDAPPPEHPVTSQIEGELRELRVRFANTRYRILYQRSGNLIVLLHAFEKDTGAVPAAETAIAKRRMADFKRRMDATPRVPPRAAGQDAPAGGRK